MRHYAICTLIAVIIRTQRIVTFPEFLIDSLCRNKPVFEIHAELANIRKRNISDRRKICLKLTKKTPERRQ